MHRLATVATHVANQPVAAATFGRHSPTQFSDEYYDSACGLVKSVQADAPTLAALGARAADTIRRGNTVWMNISVGHMPGEELAPDRVGQPSIFVCQGDDSLTPEQFEAMRPGDMLLTQRVADTTLEARDERGAYVVVCKCSRPLCVFFRSSKQRLHSHHPLLQLARQARRWRWQRRPPQRRGRP